MNIIYDLVESVNSFLWGENILVIMLIFSAIYLSFKMKFLQFRNFNIFLVTLIKIKVYLLLKLFY